MVSLGTGGTAHAAVTVQYFTDTTAYNSQSPKMAVAECPFGWFALGGTADVLGEKTQVAVQSAFPFRDVGLGKDVYIAKAVEDLNGTAGGWSLTSGVYCTNDAATTIATASSDFDSDPVKTAVAECPPDTPTVVDMVSTKIVGMGGEVSTRDGNPGRVSAFVPPTSVVFQGFETNQDLTQVTARAVEINAYIGGGHAGFWKVTAVAVCGSPGIFEGLESPVNRQKSGGPFAWETEGRVSMACSPGKRVIAAGSTIDDNEGGVWYLTRITRQNALHDTAVAWAQRNSSTTTVRQAAQAICTDA